MLRNQSILINKSEGGGGAGCSLKRYFGQNSKLQTSMFKAVSTNCFSHFLYFISYKYIYIYNTVLLWEKKNNKITFEKGNNNNNNKIKI